jgi:alcohol dehydrogenase class IV
MAADLPLKPFSYTAPTLVAFSPGALGKLGAHLKRLGASRALLVCDAHLASIDLAGRATEAAEGRVAGVFSGVLPDAPRASVEAGAEEARRLGADAVVALGGGSALDTGKAVALLAKHGGDLARWAGTAKVRVPGLPVVAIPTTAGTGSEVTNIAVLKDAELGRKLVILDRVVYPQVAVLDPSLTLGLPRALTAATGLDALTHAVEGVVSTHRQPICDVLGLECVRLIRTWLPRAAEAPGDLEARGWMLLAASMAGQLVSMAFPGVAHAVAHALGVGWGVHHGTANALLLPWSIRFNAGHPEAAVMYARCAAAFGLPAAGEDRAAALAFADAVERLVSDLGLATRLGALGVGAADLRRLAALAFADPSHSTNPARVEGAHVFEESLRALL